MNKTRLKFFAVQIIASLGIFWTAKTGYQSVGWKWLLILVGVVVHALAYYYEGRWVQKHGSTSGFKTPAGRYIIGYQFSTSPNNLGFGSLDVEVVRPNTTFVEEVNRFILEALKAEGIKVSAKRIVILSVSRVEE